LRLFFAVEKGKDVLRFGRKVESEKPYQKVTDLEKKAVGHHNRPNNYLKLMSEKRSESAGGLRLNWKPGQEY
jgi:hypothetical protein